MADRRIRVLMGAFVNEGFINIFNIKLKKEKKNVENTNILYPMNSKRVSSSSSTSEM